MHQSFRSISWDKICELKWEGDLGIRKMEDINVVFLAKQGLKILIKPDNIWVRLVKGNI